MVAYFLLVIMNTNGSPSEVNFTFNISVYILQAVVNFLQSVNGHDSILIITQKLRHVIVLVTL